MISSKNDFMQRISFKIFTEKLSEIHNYRLDLKEILTKLSRTKDCLDEEELDTLFEKISDMDHFFEEEMTHCFEKLEWAKEDHLKKDESVS